MNRTKSEISATKTEEQIKEFWYFISTNFTVVLSGRVFKKDKLFNVSKQSCFKRRSISLFNYKF